MRRLDQLTRDELVAQRAAGVAIPDGSGRLVRNGVIVSAGDVMRSGADRLRNQALEMQTGAYRAPMDALNREFARLPQPVGTAEQPGFTAPAAPSAPMTRVRTQSGTVMPDPQTVDQAELQRSLAILRDERARVGPGVKDYSDRRLDDIVRMPGGAQQIINEANAVVPVLQRTRQEGQALDYVTGLEQRARSIGVEMDTITKEIGAAPMPTADQVAAARVRVSNNPEYERLSDRELESMAQAEATLIAEAPWKAANRDRIARLEQLRREQATASTQVQDFARRGVFPRQTPALSDEAAALFGGGEAGGADPMAALRAEEAAYTQSRRDLSQARIAAGDATLPGSGMPTEGRNPGGAANVTSGMSWLPEGSIAYATRDGGFVVNGVRYPSEAEARSAIDAQRGVIQMEAAADPAALTALLTDADVVTPRQAQIEATADAMTAQAERRALIDRWFKAPPSAEREAALNALMASPDPTLRVRDLLAL